MNLRVTLTRLLGRVRRSDAEIEDELTAHVAMAEEELRAQGLSQEEAARRARLQFGGATQAREAYRQQARPPLLDSVLADLRYAVRQLGHNRSFAVLTVFTLALGIGATTAIYSIVSAVLLHSLPYDNADRLVYLYTPIAHFHLPVEEFTPSNADFFDIRRLNRSFSSMTLFGQETNSLATSESVQRVESARVDEAFFSTLGVAPEVGRVINTEDNRPGKQRVAVISHALWHFIFLDRSDILSHSITLNGSAYRVVGVMPHEFDYPTSNDLACGGACPRTTDVWLPLALTPQQTADRDNDNLNTLARLKPGVSTGAALSEMTAIMRQLDPLHNARLRGWGAAIKSLRDSIVGPVQPLLWLLLGSACCVLLVACGNAANLLLARAAARSQEFGIRTALGAGRLRMIRQLLTEALLLSAMGGAVGVGLAWLFLRLLLRLDPGDIPRLQQASLDPWVLLFTVALVLITCVLFGTLPAIHAARPGPLETLRSARGSGTAVASGRGRNLLIVGQVSLVMVLLAGAGLLVRSYLKVVSQPTGFASSTATFNVVLDARYENQAKRLATFRRLLERIAVIPGIRASGAINILPLSHAGSLSTLWVDGYAHNNPHDLVESDLVTPLYFSAMDMPLLAGRSFTDSDESGRPAVVIVNRSFEKNYFPGKSAVGKRLRTGFEANAPWETIVGVVADVRGSSLEQTPAPQIYSSFWQGDYTSANFVIRSSLSPTLLAASIRDAMRAVVPTVAAADIQTMRQVVDSSTSRRRFQTTLLTLFALTALLLALVGLYGLLAYTVRQRTPEIGVRIALGAPRGRIIAMVLAQGMRLVLAGLALGIAVALAATRLLVSALYGVHPLDPWTYAATPLLVLAATAIACTAPAWRAAHIDPMEALRAE
jgi:putative ABC transport system permease protein